MADCSTVRLERCDPAKRMLRFYALQVTPNLFGEWCLLRMRGRIGRQGQLRADWFEVIGPEERKAAGAISGKLTSLIVVENKFVFIDA